jgi:type IV pilus assembly protein PilX
MLMLATMLVAVAISRAVFASIASAGAERERALAREAAEAGVRDAERDIGADIAATADPARTAQFSAAGAGSFVEGCGRAGVARGLCSASSPPAWQALDLAEADGAAPVPYGYYTGATLTTGKGLLPARPPAYLIEKIAPPGATAAMGSFYRITAIGFGSHASTQVVLQSVYRKPLPDPAPAPAGVAIQPIQLPAGRISWREIANWPQLHAKALK